MQINEKKILVTGAAGYIGRHVVSELINRDFGVTANIRNNKDVDSRAIVTSEDIFSDTDDIYLKFGSPDILIHMAWEDGFVHNSSAHMQNLSNHVRFINNMILGGCKNIVVMGTMHEVGYWEGAISEDTPCTPLSQYGVAKNALRQSLMIQTQNTDVNVYWLRAYYIYGDDFYGNSIFSKIAIANRDGQKNFPFTTGKNKYDFISVDELASQIADASTQTQITGIINVCSGKPISLADMIEHYIKENGFNISLDYGAFPDREYDSPAVWGDNSKISDIQKNHCKE